MTRNWRLWRLGDVSWGWPDNVDQTGTDTASGYRYIPVINTDHVGYSWHVAKVFVDEDDPEMLEDAQLIAAAPALKDALERLLEVCGQAEHVHADDYTAALTAANNAIAQAEGRKRQEATQ
jgi:hypothetical protein